MAYLTAYQGNADIIVAAEPNKNIVKNCWIVDKRADVAIFIRNKGTRIRNIQRLEGIVNI